MSDTACIATPPSYRYEHTVDTCHWPTVQPCEHRITVRTNPGGDVVSIDGPTGISSVPRAVFRLTTPDEVDELLVALMEARAAMRSAR